MTDLPSLFAREDTMLGVCEGLGEETGLHPMVFRAAFALGLFWNPMLMIVAYLTLGVALMIFRWQFPARRADAVPMPMPRHGANDDAAPALARAA